MAEATTTQKTDNRSRKTLKALGRKKKKAKLKDRAVARTFFDAKSKRSTEKKSAYRKKKKGKK